MVVAVGIDADVASDGIIRRIWGRSVCAAVSLLGGRGGIALGFIWSRHVNRRFTCGALSSIATHKPASAANAKKAAKARAMDQGDGVVAVVVSVG